MSQHRQSGISILELSVVLVLITFSVFALLVVENMVAAAGIRSAVVQISRYTSATSAFRVKYNCVPGDCADAVALGIGKAGGPGDAGDGNGRVYSDSVMFATNQGNSTKETFNFWYHLGQAGLVEVGYAGYPSGGFSGNSFPGDFTDYTPNAKIHTSSFINAMTITNATDGDMPFGNAFTISGNNCGGLCGGLTAKEAAAIDSKLDDGFPESGIVQALPPSTGPLVTGDAPGCIEASTGTPLYDVNGAWENFTENKPNLRPNPNIKSCIVVITKRF